MVQAVGGVAPGAVGVAGPLVAVVGPAGRLDVLHLVAGVAPCVVLGGAGQVLGETGQRRLGVVTVAGGGTVTQGDGGTPRQVVVGIAGQADGAVLQQSGRPVEGVVAGGDVECGGFRPSGAGAVAGRVILVGQGFAAGGSAGQAAVF